MNIVATHESFRPPEILQTDLSPQAFDSALCEAFGRTTLRLFHGSIVPPETMGPYIRPFICDNRTLAHGVVPHSEKPVISTSDTPYFPVFKALVNTQHPLIAAYDFAFSAQRTMCQYEHDTPRDPQMFVNGYMLDALVQENAAGYVYGIHDVPADTVAFEDRKDLDEWRIIGKEAVWDWAARVTTLDLVDYPKDLWVIYAAKGKHVSFLRDVVQTQIGTPPELATAVEGVEVLSFRDWHNTLAHAAFA